MSFGQIWLTSYFNPARAVEGFKDKPASQWDLYGMLIRYAIASFLWCLTAYLAGCTPSPEPYLTFLSPENYYATLVLLFPALTLATWLLHGALAHLILSPVLGSSASFCAFGVV